MKTAIAINDRSVTMEEQAWWDLWNTSYRAQNQLCEVSSELFSRAADLINEFTRQSPCRVLEVGCGTGTLSRMIEFSSYLGLDFSPAAVEIARDRSCRSERNIFSKPAHYNVADFCEWQPPAEPFDVVACIDAIACIRDQSLAMEKIVASLRPGGRLVVTTVNRFVYERIRRSATVRLESGPVSKWLTHRELRSLLTGAGLSIERFETIMPRGNMGVLRILNSHKLNTALGRGVESKLRTLKESAGLGQYLVAVARKSQA